MSAVGLNKVTQFFKTRLLFLPIVAAISSFHEGKIISDERILSSLVAIVNEIEKIAAPGEPGTEFVRGRQPPFEGFARRHEEIAHVIEAIDQDHLIELIASRRGFFQQSDFAPRIQSYIRQQMNLPVGMKRAQAICKTVVHV